MTSVFKLLSIPGKCGYATAEHENLLKLPWKHTDVGAAHLRQAAPVFEGKKRVKIKNE